MLHSVPPLLVFTAAEAVTDLRDKLTEATAAAFTEAAQRTTHAAPVSTSDAPGSAASTTQTKRANARQRKSFDGYIAEARAAWTPDVAVTPAWVRQVTGCSRGLSSRLATALAAEVSEHRATPRTNGDSS